MAMHVPAGGGPPLVLSRLREAASIDGQRPALIVDGTSPLSFGGLLERVERSAAGLQALGCGPGVAVAVVLPNGVDFVVAALAVLACGAILVPLNPRFKDDELRHALQTSAVRVVVVAPETRTAAEAAGGPGVHCVDHLPMLERASGASMLVCDPEAPALYMFSSGSTGKSKRITRTQAHLLAEFDALSVSASIGPADRILCTVPLYHAHGFCNAMLAALLSGAGMVLGMGEFNARATAGLIARHGVTVYPSVPFMIKMLGDTRFAEPPDFSRLRLVFIAGAPLPETVGARFAASFAVTVGQLYGSTESGAITLNVHHQVEKPTSVGRPLAGFEVEIRGDDGQPLPRGSNGDIWIRTPATTRAYDGLPDLTAESFVDDWFFAGDTGWMDQDGDLYVTGRKKLLINVAGYKVDPLEVEEVLGSHPAVAEAVVLGVPHAGYGERVKAVVVKRTEAPDCEEADLLAFCAVRLADYKVPKLVEFRDEIPRSPLGKILRKYL